MHRIFKLFCFLVILFTGCSTEQASDSGIDNQYDLIPLPTSVIEKSGIFIIDENTAISTDNDNNEAQQVADYLAQKIKTHCGLTLSDNEPSSKGTIKLVLSDKIEAAEGYTLSVSSKQIEITAKQPNGLFYGVQTLWQLMPSFTETSPKPDDIVWAVPAVEITDAPRFPYRGMHLDVARHFFDVETVKQHLDQLAYHKMNYFHWHLTEDQGWRIEIKQYPKLTEVGAYRNGTLIGHYNDQPQQFDGKRYGGFYTQEEIKEVVAYAAERFITVVPEIEMPGHAQAALAAYPELSCDGGPFEVWQKWGVSDNVYCPTEETFTFLENVLDEVIALFPGKYIHIGGDECPKTKWEESDFCQQLIAENDLEDEHGLQSYFIQRIEKYLNSKGKQIIGWDEILEGGLAPNATVMSWRGIEGGIEAAKAGHDVIMTPTSHCYLDYYQSDHPDEPLAIGGFLPLEKVYNYEPVPEELTAEEAKHILGTQGNVWTEYIPTVEKLHYMTFPRLTALSEVMWTKKTARNFDDFVERLVPHLDRMENQGVKAANHLYEIASDITANDGKVAVDLSTLAQNAVIRYTEDGNTPDAQSPLYENTVQVDSSGMLKVQAFVGEEAMGRPWEQSFNMHAAAGYNMTLTNPAHEKYSGNGPNSVINGVLGSDERYGDAEWLGFDGKDFEGIIDFGITNYINQITLRFFNGEGQWIYLPKSVLIESSEDGENYETHAVETNIKGQSKVVSVALNLKSVPARYLRIKAENHGIIQPGNQGAGNAAWLFVDEIIVE